MDSTLAKLVMQEKWNKEGIERIKKYIPNLKIDQVAKNCGNHGSRSNSIQNVAKICGKVFNKEYQKALEKYYETYCPLRCSSLSP